MAANIYRYTASDLEGMDAGELREHLQEVLGQPAKANMPKLNKRRREYARHLAFRIAQLLVPETAEQILKENMPS